jgi:hypothetical protein
MLSAEAVAPSAGAVVLSAAEVRLAGAEVRSEAEALLAVEADPQAAAHLVEVVRRAAPSERGEAAVLLEAAVPLRIRGVAVRARSVEGAVRPAAPSVAADRSVRQVLPARAP